MSQEPALCNAPHPERPDVRCDYHAGHQPLDAIGDNRPPTIYAHGNAEHRLWWQ